jgi:WD40 repeat protein
VGERREKTVALWDLETGRGRRLLKEGFGSITSVAFAPDGDLLAAAGLDDSLVRLWEPASGRLRLRIPGHAGGTSAVRFSPDGGLLITSGSDGMVRIWRVEIGESVVSLDGRSQMLPQVLLSADGRMLAAAAYCDNPIRVWDLDEIGTIPTRGP